jgi:hypothetical protein
MEKLSAGILELYRKMGLLLPVVVHDVVSIRVDVVDEDTNENLIAFLEGKKTTDQFLLDRLLAKVDNLK